MKSTHKLIECTIRKILASLEMFKTFYSISNWPNDPFFSCNIGCSESKVVFKWWKKTNKQTNKQTNKKACKGANVPTSCISFRLSQNSLSDKQLDKQTQSEKPALSLWWDEQNLAQNVFPPWIVKVPTLFCLFFFFFFAYCVVLFLKVYWKAYLALFGCWI